MNDCVLEEARERAFKYVIFFAMTVSVISISSLSVTLPMAFSYVARLDSRIHLDTAYCDVSLIANRKKAFRCQ
ncbi:unnamed protein product [Toxocara canis]|uniref:Col_cuticle_N domain-containing protein n=1 Tax=Toxocara canis TaxID=6265 RepID=A0A183TVC5_TOXCA|nr:unnamed protein product [Toxocara canis]